MKISLNTLKREKPKEKGKFLSRVKNSLIPAKGDKPKQIIYKIIFIISIIVLIISLVLVFNYYYDIYKAHKLNDSLKNIYSQSSEEPLQSSSIDSSEVEPEPEMLSKFNELYELNSDIVGWLQIPDTTIDYAVLQTTDNDFYLHHNFLKEQNNAGALFADWRFPLTTKGLHDNTII